MKIIGIETSSIQGGVAVLEMNGNCVARQKARSLKRGLVHGKLLIPALDKLLTEANWPKNDIDLVAVDIGPGSYTGLRVGLVIAKTISYVRKTGLIGVPSLDALVRNIRHYGKYRYICPVIDARWNQVYSAIYQKNDHGCKRVTDYLAITPEDLVRLIHRYSGKILLIGDGLKAYPAVFQGLAHRAEFAPERLWFPKAQNIAALGYELYRAGKRDDPMKFLPLYLRPTEAEMNLKNKRGKINEKVPHLVRG